MPTQFTLFEPDTHVNNIYITDKPVEVSALLPHHDIVKDKYFIYPTNGTHPYANFDKKLATRDYPFVEDRDYHNTGRTKIVGLIVRDRICYPYIQLLKNSIRKFPSITKTEQKLICFHKLVGRAFLNPGDLDPYHESTVVDHIDGRPWNFRLNNLRFITKSENSKNWKKVSKQEIFDIAKLNRRF